MRAPRGPAPALAIEPHDAQTAHQIAPQDLPRAADGKGRIGFVQ
ncbi:MAG: hypothetical protein ACOVK6_04790 [Ramlibacter sp.]